jgi:hypothetical protein
MFKAGAGRIYLALMLLVIPSGALAASPAVGNDVSYPQCSKPLPTGQAFGIVGVNGGMASTYNPCFPRELAWARYSSGTLTGFPVAQLYVNTGNPGGLGTSSWPRSGSNVYGNCLGTNSLACAYQYGWNLAFLDATRPGIVIPGMFRWWLDVETVNSWDTGSAGMARNVADLEGMTAYFEGLGTQVGIYSSSTMWSTIVGNSVRATSNLRGLANWRPGADGPTEAKANCDLTSLNGGKVVMTQYSKGKFDYDLICR